MHKQSCNFTVSPDDYGGVSAQIVQFNTGDTNQTHTITINQDNSCEVEFFLTTVVLISGIQPIEAFQPLATVFIDDGIDEICGK